MIGTLETATAYSPTLGEHVRYTAYLPVGYGRDGRRHPVLYLLHGRGDDMGDWRRIVPTLEGLTGHGSVPPAVVVMPDAPWSARAGWYVDSRYTGSDLPGRPVETALTRDLVRAVDASYRTSPQRTARLIGGYSMGGAGALRIALAHPDLFAAALVLSPAVYTPLPPADSNTRRYGAFGLGDRRFDDDVYRELSYPALLSGFDRGLPLRMHITAGSRDDGAEEAEALHEAVSRVPGISADIAIREGGHGWDVWAPAFADGIGKGLL